MYRYSVYVNFKSLSFVRLDMMMCFRVLTADERQPAQTDFRGTSHRRNGEKRRKKALTMISRLLNTKHK